MWKSTKKHSQYWAERKIDWKTAYFDTFNHPHRKHIIQKLLKMAWHCLLEVGCASGPNLFLIQQTFKGCQIGGTDLNADAIKTAKVLLGKDAVLQVGPAWEIFHSDSTADVVLTDACLIYVGKDKIDQTMKELTRVCRKNLILVEFHSTSWVKRLGLKWAGGYSAYDYRKLLEKYGYYDIEIEKLPDYWKGEPWRTFGHIITAKIAKV